jgi:hypothetical protein
MFSFTLQTKSAGYRRTRNTRVYLCAASPDESGQEALDWCLDSLVQDGDEMIVFRGVEEDLLEKDHDILREEARVLMKTLEAKNMEVDSERKLSLILEYIPGKITDSIDRLIALYRPDSLIVGTRGKRGIMGLNLSGIGSISKCVLSPQRLSFGALILLPDTAYRTPPSPLSSCGQNGSSGRLWRSARPIPNAEPISTTRIGFRTCYTRCCGALDGWCSPAVWTEVGQDALTDWRHQDRRESESTQYVSSGTGISE